MAFHSTSNIMEIKRKLNLDYIPVDVTQRQDSDKTISNYFAQFFQGFRILDLQEGDELVNGFIPKNHFFFLLEGKARFSMNEGIYDQLSDGQMLLVPLNATSQLIALQHCKIVIHSFSSLLPEAEAQVNLLYKQNPDYKEQHIPILPIHPLVRSFGWNVYEIIRYGKMNPTLMRLKRLEIFTLLVNTLSIDNLLSFFYPLLNKQYSFRTIVINSPSMVTVDDLVSRSGMCRTKFYQRFKQEFHMSVHQWLQLRRAFQVREVAGYPGMTVKALMTNMKFASSSTFVSFCQTFYGCTPSALIASVRNGCIPMIRHHNPTDD